MSLHLAISPDVHARDLSFWFMLNTRLQRATGEAIRASVYDDFAELHAAYTAGGVDLVYANAADTALLVREHAFVPVARPVQVADEAVVVVSADSPVHTLQDLPATLSVAATDAPDVERICRILLEPADLGPDAITLTVLRNYVLVVKALVSGQAQAGFFLRAAYDDLAEVTRARLRPVISSRIYVISHTLLVSPANSALAAPVWAALQSMTINPADAELLAGLGAPAGWEPASQEDVEFMVDLMDTLQQ